jgi:uncharacterized protein (TIGR03437 family)
VFVANGTAGSYQVTAAAGPLSAAFSLTNSLTPPPVISEGGVVSASSFGEFTSVAPGSWIEIYGSNLASGTRSWQTSDFSGVNAPTSLDDTSVTIAGQSAFVEHISPGQVNAQVPSNVATGMQQLIVTGPGGASAPYTLKVNAVEPGFDAPQSFNIDRVQYVVALLPDGSFVLPVGAIAGVKARPAKPGEIITLYGVGFGPVVPAITAGQLVQQLNTLAMPFNIFFGGAAATVSYVGLAPDLVGLYQVNVSIPAITPSNQVPLTFTLGQTNGAQTLYVAVAN